MTVIKKKRRRKSRYKTGIHKSPKCTTPINYRSSWEYTICLYLDDDPEVVSYSYESIKIPYIANKKSGRLRNYYPDFLVHYANGKTLLVEVKRQNQLNNLKVIKKAEAGKLWASQNKAEYRFWSDKMVLPLKRAYKIKLAAQHPKKKKRVK